MDGKQTIWKNGLTVFPNTQYFPHLIINITNLSPKHEMVCTAGLLFNIFTKMTKKPHILR